MDLLDETSWNRTVEPAITSRLEWWMFSPVARDAHVSQWRHVTTGKSSVDRQLGTSYVLATGGALATALGLNNLVKVSVVIMSEESTD
jgi:hypothetical protein